MTDHVCLEQKRQASDTKPARFNPHIANQGSCSPVSVGHNAEEPIYIESELDDSDSDYEAPLVRSNFEPCSSQDSQSRSPIVQGGVPDEPIFIPSDVDSDLSDSGDNGTEADTKEGFPGDDESDEGDVLELPDTHVTKSHYPSQAIWPVGCDASFHSDREAGPGDSPRSAVASAEPECVASIRRSLSASTATFREWLTADRSGKSKRQNNQNSMQPSMATATPAHAETPTAYHPTPKSISNETTDARPDTEAAQEDVTQTSIVTSISEDDEIPTAGCPSPRSSYEVEGTPDGTMDHSRSAPSSARTNWTRRCQSQTLRQLQGQSASDSDLESDGDAPFKRRQVDNEYLPGSDSDAGYATIGDSTERKRRKISGTLRNTRSSHSRQDTADGCILVDTRPHMPATALPSPSHSGGSSDDGEVGAHAKFEEWPLTDVTLKRIMVDGDAVFQIQFGWQPGANHYEATHTSRRLRGRAIKNQTRAAQRPLALTFTPEENQLLRDLKEGEANLTWSEIHKQFNEASST